MSGNTSASRFALESVARSLKPYYHTPTDLFLWHQYQGQETNDCAAYSIAIAANALLNERRFDGATVARAMEKVTLVRSPLPHFALRKIPRFAALPWGISGYLQSQHIPARLHWFGQVDDLMRNIRENRPTIVLLGEILRGWAHAKVLYGFEPTGPQPQRGYYFVDPGYPREWARPQHPLGVFVQDVEEFKREWNNLFRIYVDLGV